MVVREYVWCWIAVVLIEASISIVILVRIDQSVDLIREVNLTCRLVSDPAIDIKLTLQHHLVSCAYANMIGSSHWIDTEVR